jgi:hypothetical protein
VHHGAEQREIVRRPLRPKGLAPFAPGMRYPNVLRRPKVAQGRTPRARSRHITPGRAI